MPDFAGLMRTTLRQHSLVPRPPAAASVAFANETPAVTLPPHTRDMARQSSEDCFGPLTSQEGSENRYTAYKKLIAELSEHLVPEDLKQIIFLRSLPDILKNSSALDVLEYMEKHGKLSPTDIQSLSGLLKDVHRNDLVNKYVEEYQRKFGRHSSMPTSRSPQHPPNRRANTFPSDMKCAVATSACLPVQETEDSTHGSYMPSNDTHMHSHGREPVSQHQFVASTQPQPASLTVKAQVQQLEGNPSSYTNYSSELYSHPPETTMHQFSSYQDQTQAVESYIPHRGGSTQSRHLSEHVSTSTPVHYRQTSTPLPPIHQCLPSNPVPIRAIEYENSTPASLSASNSIHDMYSVHNHAVFDQESRYTSSPSSANVSQDLLPEARGTMGAHYLGRQHLQHNPLSSQFSDMHIGQREAFPTHQSQPWYHVYNNSQEFLPSSQSLMVDHRLRMEASYRPSSTPPPTFQRRTSVPETTLRSTQIERLPLQPHSASFSHSPYPHKKSSAPASTAVSDSGVEMVHHKAGPGSTASESIEPWMSVSNEKEQFERSWMQPRPRTRSVSTGVQTENGEGSEKILTPATLSPIASICDESEDSNEGQDTGKPVVVKKSRPLAAKLKLPLTRSRSFSKLRHSIRWVLKRNKLNKAIYEHKENKRITCPTKLVLDAGCGGANPRLVFHLVPYGLETDSGKNATLEIEIEVPKKCPRMHSATKVKVSVSVRELKEEKFLARHGGVEKSMNLRQFLIPQFVTHGNLKDSRCDQIEIHASAELIVYSKLTHSP